MANSSGQKYECPVCSESCDDFVFPAVTPDALCAKDFVLESSEISKIYIGNPSDTFAIGGLDDAGCWTATAADFEGVISTDATAGTIRCLCGKGDMPAGTPNTVEICRQRTVLIDNTYQFNFDVDNNTKLNYAFLSQISCTREVCFWFETMGCAIYGGPTGISGTITAASPVFARGAGNSVQYSYSIEFKAACPPPRLYPNPIAAA